MTDEDRILIDLFRHRHERGAPRAKRLLVEHREHRALIDRLCEQGDVLALGDNLFHITLQGQRRITTKYPDLWEA